MKSLRRVLTARLLIGGILLFGTAGGLLEWHMRHALTREFDESLHGMARSLASATEQDKTKLKLEAAMEYLPQFAQNGSDFFQMSGGKRTLHSQSLGVNMLPTSSHSLDAPEVFEHTLPDGRMIRLMACQFSPKEDDDASFAIHAFLTVGRDTTPLRETIRQIRIGIFLIGVASLACMFALVRWSVRGGLLPLENLGNKVGAIDATSLHVRMPEVNIHEELQPITAGVNGMLERVEAAFQREQRFTANVAHELRTPLAELRALAEVNLTTPADIAENRQSWEDVLSSSKRMEVLSLRLLDLARAGNGAPAIERTKVALADAVRRSWKPHEARAAARGVNAVISINEGAFLETEPALFDSILSNLSSNAATHAPEHSRVQISLEHDKEGMRLIYQNPCRSLEKEDVTHLFEPFWKSDTSRTDAHNLGLGLALAQELARLLGCHLSAELLPSRDLQIVLRLS